MTKFGTFLLAAGVAVLPNVAWAGDIIAARTLPAGSTLAASDLAPAEDDTLEVVRQMEQMLGLQTRRAFFAGQIIDTADLIAPRLVARNEIVTLRYSSGALGIRTEARALEPGGRGERIRVMNLGSRTTITAVVSGAGQVEVRR